MEAKFLTISATTYGSGSFHACDHMAILHLIIYRSTSSSTLCSWNTISFRHVHRLQATAKKEVIQNLLWVLLMNGISIQWPKNCLNVSLVSGTTPKSAAISHQMPHDIVQVIRRWCKVSECSEQNGQVGGPSIRIPLCMSNTFVFNLPSKASQKKNSTFGGAKLSHTLQIKASTSLVWDCCNRVCSFFEVYPQSSFHTIPSSWLHWDLNLEALHLLWKYGVVIMMEYFLWLASRIHWEKYDLVIGMLLALAWRHEN